MILLEGNRVFALALVGPPMLPGPKGHIQGDLENQGANQGRIDDIIGRQSHILTLENVSSISSRY